MKVQTLKYADIAKCPLMHPNPSQEKQMPVFLFSDDYSKLEKRVFMKAARVACRILQADHYDATIEVIRGYLGHSRKAAIKNISPGYFKLITASGSEPQEIVHSIGHELIHFHQFARGDMVEKKNKIIWKGISFRPVNVSLGGSLQDYLDLPWEQEAFAKHNDLFKAVTQEIPMKDREALNAEFEDSGVRVVELPDFLRELIEVLERGSRRSA